MSTKVYVVVIAVVAIIVLLAALLTAGDQVSDKEIHKCSTSTIINDLFCKEN